jgi:hypothetical protein
LTVFINGPYKGKPELHSLSKFPTKSQRKTSQFQYGLTTEKERIYPVAVVNTCVTLPLSFFSIKEKESCGASRSIV